MPKWKKLAKQLGFLEPTSCSLSQLESITKHLDGRENYLDPHVLKNFADFRFPEKSSPMVSSQYPLRYPTIINQSSTLWGISIFFHILPRKRLPLCH